MRPNLSMQALEAFEAVARTRSLSGAAAALGMSISSVSHHVGRLEEELGTQLLDRSCRPMRLTSAGLGFLSRVEEGLRQIRLARSEAAMGGLSASGLVRIGMIDDLQAAAGPALALDLARALPRASLSIRTVTSLDAVTLLESRDLEVAVAAEAGTVPAGLRILPLLRDPFALAVREGLGIAPVELIGGAGPTLLRFPVRTLIGRQIDAQLRRAGVAMEARLEFDDAAAIMALVAAGEGWSVLTPLVFERTWRWRDAVALHPLPIPAFARRIVLYARDDAPAGLAERMATFLRARLAEACVAPAVARFGWLEGQVRVEGLT